MPLLEMSGITKRFGATLALDQVALSVEAGEVHALVGENGSGKSTLMRVLAGVLMPDAGVMKIDGQPYSPNSPKDARDHGIAMIHQELSICGDLSVAENIVLGIEKHRLGMLKVSEINRIAREAMTMLGHPDLDVEILAKKLPLATRQLIEIGRAVAMNSRIVVLDEPTSSLTEADVKRLFTVVAKLKAAGKAVLYISHFLDEIHQICDRLSVLRDGQYIGTRPVQGITDEDIVSMMVGRSIEDLYPRSPHTIGEVLLDIDYLAGAKKPREATLKVHRGEVVGLAGLNGSGRTELLRLLFGLDPIKSGSIKIGVIQGPASPAARWATGVGLLSEDRKNEGLALNLTIAENIALSGLKPGLVHPGAQAESAKNWIKQLKIRCKGPEQPVGALSGGNQQKVALARMLDQGVDLLLLDEPTRGIDVGSKQQIYQLIDDLALSGKAVLVVSSYLPELLGTCDRIAAMNRGVLSNTIDASEATQESLMKLAVG